MVFGVGVNIGFLLIFLNKKFYKSLLISNLLLISNSHVMLASENGQPLSYRILRTDLRGLLER